MRVKRLGLLIRHYRKKHGILQKTMAQTLSVSKAQLSKIEMQKHEPKGELSLKILEILIPSIKSDILLLEIEVETNGNRK